jgi:hypothetical protein
MNSTVADYITAAVAMATKTLTAHWADIEPLDQHNELPVRNLFLKATSIFVQLNLIEKKTVVSDRSRSYVHGV